jgi:DNA-3-methyladenine glycosylase II
MDYSAALQHLTRDPKLARVMQTVGQCNIGAGGDPFQSLVRAIIYQQLAGKAAATIYGRFVNLYGKFPEPSGILRSDDSALRSCGLSGRKIQYIKDLAAHVDENRLDLKSLPSLVDEQIIDQLTAVKGIGRWTSEMFLIFCLGRPDVLPVQDLGLRKGIQKTYRLRKLPTLEKINKIAEPWRPYRSVATWYMWRSLEL